MVHIPFKLHNFNGPFEISISPLQNLMGPESLISILEDNRHEI